MARKEVRTESKGPTTVKDFTEALVKLGKEVKSGTKLPALKRAFTLATKKSDKAAKSSETKPANKKRTKANGEASENQVFGMKFGTYTLRKLLGKGDTKTDYHVLANDVNGNRVTLHVPKKFIDHRLDK